MAQKIRRKSKKVFIVGAGPGGLATAMVLARRGVDVTVFEKDEVIGGRSKELKLGPYSFDLGPTFLMMKYVLDDLINEISGDEDRIIERATMVKNGELTKPYEFLREYAEGKAQSPL